MSENCVLSPYGKTGNCAKMGVECLTCHTTYIGETGRPLCVRINKHLASKKRGSSKAVCQLVTTPPRLNIFGLVST
ncbi:hypothetical protein Y032_0001g146 [Ancylostoma ceylanicum]|uniref:Uncharacterized protein n=1 Tax=Ancylostoma ceylanicum TaxID=53326 RepID=A0A016W2S2_9BILA|nr:hypothetical protein Y032_0001g146 [Ancylostoma ceylanicum]